MNFSAENKLKSKLKFFPFVHKYPILSAKIQIKLTWIFAPKIISRFSHIKQSFQYFVVFYSPLNLLLILSIGLAVDFKNHYVGSSLYVLQKHRKHKERGVGEESGELIYKFCRWLSCQVGILQAPCSTSFCLNACFSRLLFLSCFQSFFCCYSRSSIDAAFSFTSEKIFETKTNLI